MSQTETFSFASRRVPVAIVLALTLASGVVHGVLDGRWAQRDDLVKQGAQLDQLPETMGDWQLQSTDELPKGAQQLLRCYGSTLRVYQNENTGDLVNVALMLGPRGPMAVHTPEVCYTSVGTRQVTATRVQSVATNTRRHRFWSVQFAKDPQPEASLEVWYAWSDGEHFEAATYPRIWMTDSLYKIQIAGPPGRDLRQPIQDFLTACLPHVEKVVY